MEDFITFVAKHGETGVQALLESWERYNGIKTAANATLESRWALFMCQTAEPEKAAA